MWIVLKNLLNSLTGCELSQNGFYSNAWHTHYWFTYHNIGV
jgi:hypothetical protein